MALLPADVFYSARGERVCAGCWTDPAAAPARPGRTATGPAGRPPLRSARDRRLSVLRWSLVFAILAASTLHIRQIAVTELRSICPRLWIDAPAQGAEVPAHFIVRGRIALESVTRPLWVVSHAQGASGMNVDLLPRPIVADMFGEFAAPIDLLGHAGQRYRIFVASADEMANVWLESGPTGPSPSSLGPSSGMTMLGAIDVVLGTGGGR